ncbi:unnamed protein product [Kuraishia capsulata CBS 1993]|uniref:Condensin complex subunit 2 n=1 Tax=Kuraishia capsulata CBS 1993 TaxID=1382522 RepID=W6ML72_9ASCO|nr:uncharacterized protein KUCA_T00003189001 [Kuraishia capsulata CBS 1993]CDK27211.1 unnamed protein product [Kuraishia capsulata CBS 1993]
MTEVASSSDGRYDHWMKLLNDNKITSQNTWEMPLIDYFHDSVFQGGKNISFQKASATLDGCVKVYSSRVDSAATEVGRLLTNLQTDNREEDDDDEEGGSDEDDELERATSGKQKRIVTRSTNTLVKSIDMITIKELDKEEFVNPVFKKALTDFDEGGAKSLLLNMLKLDNTMRVVFATTTADEQHKEIITSKPPKKIDLGFVFKVMGESHEHLSVCPSMPQMEEAAREGNLPPSLLEEIGETTMALPNLDADEMPDFDNFENGYGDDNDDVHKTTLNPLDDIENTGHEDDEPGFSTMIKLFDDSFVNKTDGESFVADENVLQYLDNASKFTWAGPEHWKIANLKRATRVLNILPEDDDEIVQPNIEGEFSKPKAPRKKKDQERINMFESPPKAEDELFAESSNTIISGKLWDSLHLLPDDKHFSTRQLIHLWHKPTRTTSLIFFKEKENKLRQKKYDEYDENFFAAKYQEKEEESHDDFLNDDDLQDYNEIQQSVAEGYFDEGNALIGSQEGKLLLSQADTRPGAINFARVAKKVDVRLLKENIWDTLSHETAFMTSRKRSAEQSEEEAESPDLTQTPLVFSDLVSQVGSRYKSSERKDLSTSYCFICLLHLANENGFTVEDNSDHSDLLIKGSLKAISA